MKQRLALLLGARHQPVRLPLAAGRPSRAGQQRPARLQAGPAGERPLRRAGPRVPGSACRWRQLSEAPRSWPCMWRRFLAGASPWSRERSARSGRIAWCTGGAQGYFEAAIAAGADAFITGEISEPQAHYARECGVAFLACGHHASERYGAPAVAAHVARSSWAWSTNSSTSTTRHERADRYVRWPSRMGDPAGHRARDHCQGLPRCTRTLTRGCFVAGDVATLRRAAQAIRAAWRRRSRWH